MRHYKKLQECFKQYQKIESDIKELSKFQQLVFDSEKSGKIKISIPKDKEEESDPYDESDVFIGILNIGRGFKKSSNKIYVKQKIKNLDLVMFLDFMLESKKKEKKELKKEIEKISKNLKIS